jgi:hypothetical protein
MATSGDLELSLRTECAQDESEVPHCEFCSDIHMTNIEELPLGIAQDCSNCRLLLDAIETWNETENLQLHRYFHYPGVDSPETWYQSWIELETEEFPRKHISLRVSPDASTLSPIIPCHT